MELMDEQFIRLIKEKLVLQRNCCKMKENTLRSMCLKAVLHNAAVSNKTPSLVHGIERLPEVLLTDLERMMSNLVSESRFVPSTPTPWRFLRSLLHPCLTKLRLPGSSYWTEDMFLEIVGLLDEIGAKCSGLQLFESKMEDIGQKLEEDSPPKAAFFQALPQLRNLQVVKIHSFLCDDWALQQFGMHCKNIVILQVVLAEDVSDIGIEALAKLTHLKQLLFTHHGKEYPPVSPQLVLKCVLLCAQHLPKLRIVGSDFDAVQEAYIDESDADGICTHSQVVQLPLQLGLEQVILSGQVVTNPCCLLPNLRSMLLYYPYHGDVSGLCSRYSNVSELIFYGAECVMILQAVQVIGFRLEKLMICEIGENSLQLQLFLILKCCPNLKDLKVHGCHLENFDYPLSKNDVSCLETLELSLIDTMEPPIHKLITKLLGAPLLKKVDFYETYLTKVEVDALLASVWNGSILTNIESFRWVNHYEEDEMRSWMASQKHFKLLLATIQASCPKLNS